MRWILMLVLAGCVSQQKFLELRVELDALHAERAKERAEQQRIATDLAKATTLIAELYEHLEYQQSVRSGWWCGSVLCERDKTKCTPDESRPNTKSGGEREDTCKPQRRVYCRGIGSAKAECYRLLSQCERLAGAGVCFGVE